MNLIHLDKRFQPISDWTWEKFTRLDHSLRFGYYVPAKARCIVIILPGLSEFAEKYFETLRDLLAANCGVFVLDWMGQGGSGRYLSNPHKRHSSGFDDDVADLDVFIKEHVQKIAPGLPLIMLAHSMGAHIGLRYMCKYPDVFSCAALSAPMNGIAAINRIPAFARLPIGQALRFLFGNRYTGPRGDWREDMRIARGEDPFSSDPARRAIHNYWCLKNPALQVGRVTFGWVYEALRSCHGLIAELQAAPLQTPLLIGLAGRETIVDNEATRRLLPCLKNAHILDLPESRHEILMEIDAVRNAFLQAFRAFAGRYLNPPAEQGKIAP